MRTDLDLTTLLYYILYTQISLIRTIMPNLVVGAFVKKGPMFFLFLTFILNLINP